MENYACQLSMKCGPNGAAMVNLRAMSAPELDAMAHELNQLISQTGRIDELIQTLAALGVLESTFGGSQVVPTSAPEPAQPAYRQAPPAQQYGPPTAQTPGDPCAHGVARKRQEGHNKKTNKPWKAQFCVVENDPHLPQCEPVWHW